ncbi:unnamed protein product [Cladocopium goreaui]|uniref:Uncharacterized protein n=1 Tax=Cladocopium goreaui TaxID=2562237 RepID=A0A9P1D7N3_9DINO|nr:unnamed protein product [Cladocopium goreaui]
MLLLEALLPLAQFNLKAKVDPVVTCSDASESGGGMCFSSRLSWAGRAEAEWLVKEGPDKDPQRPDAEVVSEEKILVIDLFAGLGGLEVALEKAGVRVHHSLMVEKDVDCRHLLRRSHLEDERSALFYEAVRVMEMVENMATERRLWVVKFLENVVPDESDSDIDEMSAALKIHPILVESGKLSRVRRPALHTMCCGWRSSEPVGSFLKQGITWLAGEADGNLKFPTFTRSIPRRRPPPCPAGLDSTDIVTRDRWKDDQFRYPPYVYAEKFLVKGTDDVLRTLAAAEREVLMGYPRGCTSALPEGEEETRNAKDLRCAAIGNSFHTNTVAAIFDKAFATMGLKKEKGVQRIVDQFVSSLEDPPEPSLADDAPVSEGEDMILEREDDEESLIGERGTYGTGLGQVARLVPGDAGDATVFDVAGLCCKIVGLTEMVGDWRWEPLSCASNPLDVGGHGKLRFGEANKFGDLQNRRVEAVFPK